MESWIQETAEAPRRSLLAVQVPRRNFEGLFQHALRPSGSFAQALRDVGYDLESAEEYFPLEVWRAALAVARRHACPGLAGEEANRVLGTHYVEGFAQTLVGRIFATAAPLLGVERCLARLPTYLRAGREDMKLVLQAVRAREWRATVVDADPLPDFVAGVVEQVLRRTRVLPRVDVLERAPQGYSLRIRWNDA
ncbi:DUF2378 family protein [Corallococcus sp. ZKHCc1 1396]|uniref:DUF2378 family protein n=1 Tax=Corallococcus soli TaxID=2710757 RepID=A0ABR9PTA8_9BACT|nr:MULTISPECIES: DUF2378 family protein [Corallococcus]MBE4751163.1 DUF2378 family protein [Corallococcus soli]MCY1034083.1 DUF2378 family protein [Corallococcus sp. BB11-1]